MEIEHGTFKFEKQKGKFHGQINLLGIAYAPDGAIAARFSDALKLDLDDKKQVEAVQEKALHYENQFEIAPGQYTVKVAFSGDGETYGKLEMPMKIDPYQDGQFGISDLALSREVLKSSQRSEDAVLLEDRLPLLFNGMQLVPTGDAVFQKTDNVAMYFEVYEPLLAGADPAKAPQVGFQLKILDKQGQAVQDSGVVRIDVAKLTTPVVSQGVRVPIEALTPGPYQVEMTVLDSVGKTAKRLTPFEIQ
jgi:hypothetical protein